VATVAEVVAQYRADTAAYTRPVQDAARATEAFGRSTQGVSGQIDALGQSAEKASGGFTILKGALATGLGVAAVGMIQNAVGSVKNFAMESFHAAARVDELNIAMGAIGEATGIGEKAIRDAADAVRANGIEMAASQQIAIEFAQAQLDMGAASKVARVAQDLAVIGAKNSTETTMLLTRAIITGQSELLKSAGISKTAGEAYRAMAESLGISESALSTTQKQQAVTNMIIEEGGKVAGTYEAAMDSAGKVLRSFPRIVNDIQVAIGGVLTEAFGPMIKAGYDLLKTFSLSVQEGGALKGTIDRLKDSFIRMSQPIVDGIENLKEMVASGELVASLGRTIDYVIPIVESLVEGFFALRQLLWAGLQPVLQVVSQALVMMKPALDAVAAVLKALPAPVQAIIGAFLLMQIALVKLGTSWVAANAKITSSMAMMAVGAVLRFAQVAAAAKKMAWQILGSFLSAGTSAKGFGISLQGMRATATAAMLAVALAARGLALAMKALLTSLGPIGIALIAITAPLEFFMGRAAATQHHVENLRAEVDALTGALTEAGAAFVAKELQMNISGEDLAMLEQYGFTLEGFISAMQDGEASAEAYLSRLEGFDDFFTATQKEKIIWGTLTGMVDQYGESLVASQQDVESNRVAAISAGNAARDSYYEQMDAARALAFETEVVASRAENMTEAQYRAGVQTRITADYQQALADVTNATAAAIMGLFNAQTQLNGLFSEHDAMLGYENALAALKEQLSSNTAGLDGTSEAAQGNYAALKEAGNAAMTYATQLEDPVAGLEYLKEVYRTTAQDFKDQGMDPKDSKLLVGMKETIQGLETEVAGMEDAVAMAEARGLDVGVAIAEGLVQGMSEMEAVAAGGLEMGKGAVDAVADGARVSSPSQATLETGRNVTLGLQMGMLSGMSSAVMMARLVGVSVAQGIAAGINAGLPAIVAAARAAAAAALAAARAALKVSSPSKAFYEIGAYTMQGLADGITDNAVRAARAAADAARGVSAAGQVEFGSSPMDSARSAVASQYGTGAGSVGRSGGGLVVENLNVTSARGERAEETVPRALRRMAWVANLDG